MPTAATAPACPSAVTLEHLSYSAISCYSNCPRKFYFRYIEHAPEEVVPAALAFGGAFHRAAESIHQSRIEGCEIPDVESLLRSYDEAWSELTRRGIPVVHAKEEDEKSLRFVHI